MEVIDTLFFGCEESLSISADCEDVDNASVNNYLFTLNAVPAVVLLPCFALLCSRIRQILSSTLLIF